MSRNLSEALSRRLTSSLTKEQDIDGQAQLLKLMFQVFRSLAQLLSFCISLCHHS